MAKPYSDVELEKFRSPLYGGQGSRARWLATVDSLKLRTEDAHRDVRVEPHPAPSVGPITGCACSVCERLRERMLCSSNRRD